MVAEGFDSGLNRFHIGLRQQGDVFLFEVRLDLEEELPVMPLGQIEYAREEVFQIAVVQDRVCSVKQEVVPISLSQNAQFFAYSCSRLASIGKPIGAQPAELTMMLLAPPTTP